VEQACRVAVVSYGTGNIASLQEAFAAVGSRCHLAQVPADLQAADAIVLPGVGHFGAAVASLAAGGLRAALLEQIRAGVPTLGICLGFQLLTTASEEAPASAGLGLLPLRTERIRPVDSRRHKVPHLGWNSMANSTGAPRLLQDIEHARQLFYFANAYAVAPIATFHGASARYHHCRDWLGLVEQGNIHGVQFHPEKSRSQGLQLLRNFLTTA
jgi:imidazole glycerol phosphate synthase glutamine amidotransferase subunit